jgi:hypothetical protein
MEDSQVLDVFLAHVPPNSVRKKVQLAQPNRTDLKKQ